MNTAEQIKSNKSFSGADMIATCHFPSADGSGHIYTLGSLQTLTYSLHMERRPVRSIGNINAKDYVMGPRTVAGTLIFAVFNQHFAYEAMDGIREEYDPTYRFLADELPAFDITISFANEYGAQSRMVIYGIRLVNEGQVMSINDIYTENTYQFVATDIEYMKDSGNSYSNLRSEKMSTEPAVVISTNDGKKIREAIATDIVRNTQDPEVTVTPIYPATETKKGTVRITVSPYDQEGSIKIQGKSLNAPMIINIAEFKGKPIYVSLAAGTYNVIYRSKKKSSAPRSFSISASTNESVTFVSSPSVEFVTPQGISIYSNSTQHTIVCCSYVNEVGHIVVLQEYLAKRRAVIKGLVPGTNYTVYTKNTTHESLKRSVRTPLVDYSEFKDLRDYITHNQNYLTYGTLPEYLVVLDDMLILAEQSPLLSAAQAAVMHKSLLAEEFAALDSSQFATPEEHAAKMAELTKEDNITYQILSMANMISNNANWAINMASKVRPPRPELIDVANNVFLVDEGTERLEFYRQVKGVSQFATEIHRYSFIRNIDGKLSYRFLGKQGMSYYVYAINKMGDRSARFDFYCMGDTERSAILSSNAVAVSSYASTVSPIVSLYGKEIQALKISPEGESRILLQLSRSDSAGIFPAPTITDKGPNYIRLDVDYPDLISPETESLYVVLAETQNVMLAQARHRILLSYSDREVSFFDSPHGIRPDTTYLVWIEDGLNRQLSPSSSVRTYSEPSEQTDTEDETIRSFFWQKTLTKIKEKLAIKIGLTAEIEEIFENLKENDEAGEHTVFEELIQNAIRHYPRISNIDPLVFALCKVKTDMTYHPDPQFFEEQMKVSGGAVVFPAQPDEYVIVKAWIRPDVISWSTMPVGIDQVASMPIEESSGYVMMFAMSPRTHGKSGILFGNLFTNKFEFYPIETGGVL